MISDRAVQFYTPSPNSIFADALCSSLPGRALVSAYPALGVLPAHPVPVFFHAPAYAAVTGFLL